MCSSLKRQQLLWIRHRKALKQVERVQSAAYSPPFCPGTLFTMKPTEDPVKGQSLTGVPRRIILKNNRLRLSNPLYHHSWPIRVCVESHSHTAVSSRFYTRQQAASVAVLSVVRRFRQKVVNWGPAGLCMRCRCPALLCDPQPGSFKTMKQLITSVSPSLHLQTSRWTTGQLQRSRRCSVSSVSVAVWLC